MTEIIKALYAWLKHDHSEETDEDFDPELYEEYRVLLFPSNKDENRFEIAC
jgi:aspartate/methionine/tyrosine aminotransferase